MESHNECCKFPLGQVLHFVNREQYTGARCESGLTKLDEKVCEVVIKQAGICPTGLLGKINRQERTVSSRNMHLHETSQNPERSLQIGKGLGGRYQASRNLPYRAARQNQSSRTNRLQSEHAPSRNLAEPRALAADRKRSGRSLSSKPESALPGCSAKSIVKNEPSPVGTCTFTKPRRTPSARCARSLTLSFALSSSNARRDIAATAVARCTSSLASLCS